MTNQRLLASIKFAITNIQLFDIFNHIYLYYTTCKLIFTSIADDFRCLFLCRRSSAFKFHFRQPKPYSAPVRRSILVRKLRRSASVTAMPEPLLMCKPVYDQFSYRDYTKFASNFALKQLQIFGDFSVVRFLGTMVRHNSSDISWTFHRHCYMKSTSHIRVCNTPNVGK